MRAYTEGHVTTSPSSYFLVIFCMWLSTWLCTGLVTRSTLFLEVMRARQRLPYSMQRQNVRPLRTLSVTKMYGS